MSPLSRVCSDQGFESAKKLHKLVGYDYQLVDYVQINDQWYEDTSTIYQLVDSVQKNIYCISKDILFRSDKESVSVNVFCSNQILIVYGESVATVASATYSYIDKGLDV